MFLPRNNHSANAAQYMWGQPPSAVRGAQLRWPDPQIGLIGEQVILRMITAACPMFSCDSCRRQKSKAVALPTRL